MRAEPTAALAERNRWPPARCSSRYHIGRVSVGDVGNQNHLPRLVRIRPIASSTIITISRVWPPCPGQTRQSHALHPESGVGAVEGRQRQPLRFSGKRRFSASAPPVRGFSGRDRPSAACRPCRYRSRNRPGCLSGPVEIARAIRSATAPVEPGSWPAAEIPDLDGDGRGR